MNTFPEVVMRRQGHLYVLTKKRRPPVIIGVADCHVKEMH